MNETVFFRVDANSQIGMGHAMRCITIAKKLHEKGLKCYFLGSDNVTGQIIEENGLQFECLDTNYRDLTEEEALDISGRMRKRNSRVLIVDSYYAQEKYFTCLRQKREILVVCFWYFEREIPVDILINYNVNYNRLFYEKTYSGKDIKLLLGSDYVPLREEFGQTNYVVKQQVNTILLMTGGTDTFNFIGQFLEYVKESAMFHGVRFICVSGNYNPNFEKIRKIQDTWDKVQIIEKSENVSELMKQSDLVLSAGGTTMYELCAIGVPTILFSFADNQISEATYMGKEKIMVYAGDIREKDFWEKLMDQLVAMFSDVKMRKRISENMRRVIDGKGTNRIVENILSEKEKKRWIV